MLTRNRKCQMSNFHEIHGNRQRRNKRDRQTGEKTIKRENGAIMKKRSGENKTFGRDLTIIFRTSIVQNQSFGSGFQTLAGSDV